MTDAIRKQLQDALGTDFTLGRELGGGGMSRVFVARDETLGRDVVVKLLSPALAQELSAERFAREIRLAANLQHAHIVPLLSAGATTAGLPYYLMPFVEGASLRQRLESGTLLPASDVVSVLRDVARALAYAHARGVVHRDIKPDNIMYSGGAAVVTDFGIAKALTSAREEHDSDTLTRMGTSIGTPAYMAPEQGTGDPNTDHRADIYAFGATAYELLTGVTPFGDRAPHELMVAHLTEAPLSPDSRRSELPHALSALVMQCLEKDPDHRPQTADEVLSLLGSPHITGATATYAAGNGSATTGLRTATKGGATSTGSSQTNHARRAAITVSALLVTGLVAFFGWKQLQPKAAALDASMLAVMPFTIRDKALDVWREGMVDVLSRSLDGAGALRTIAPSTSIQRSPERADVASALTLGTDVGAGLVLFGDLSASGPDSVHLRAALFDVRAGAVRTDIDLIGARSRMDALADSLALRVLRELGHDAGAGASRLDVVGTRSLPALKAFLQGQQFYRRALVDSARMSYQTALEYDSTFALAWRGVASVFIRAGRENEPDAMYALDQAIRYKSGRGPRDSMMLRADSLRLAVVRRAPAPMDALADVPLLSALLSTLETATTRYPTDGELWFELGDARFHFGEFGGVTLEQAADAFERGINLDSSFTVPYYHAMDLAMRSGRTQDAARYARRVVAVYSGNSAMYYTLLAAVLESTRALTPEAERLLDSLPGQYVAGILGQVAFMPDSNDIGLVLARRLMARPSPTLTPIDSSSLRDAIAGTLIARGLFREAQQYRGAKLPLSVPVQLAQIGARSRDSVAANAADILRSDPASALAAARLFADVGDTSSLVALRTWLKGSVQTAVTRQYSSIIDALMPFARGDSAATVQALLAIPVSVCSGVPCAGSITSELLVAAGRDADAARILDRWLPSAHLGLSTPMDHVRRARIAMRNGENETARRSYGIVVARWGGGDPVLQPVVQEAKAALAKLRP